ncbi:regulatory protein RecX [Dokdonella sp.]|uniref:regulatory protein RecX n=1 Tax=Dokdonella sp. TaxID=2291710 RepID=UPI001B0328AA|nr:regulatory protein RecX [Dokdonella sp.]MBO9663290.1 regulatory protein RecX [Dokdonella sp.]
MSRRSSDKPAKRSAYEQAVGLLARREHSARELKTKLRSTGRTGDEAEQAIGRLQEQRYQDDERFAASLARRRAAQGYGPLRIQAELKSHGLGDAAIRAAIAVAAVDWAASAAAQLRRHAGSARSADAAERAKRAAFLLRRGFDAATVRAVTRAEPGDPDLGLD